jgi:hypothetical protein
MGRQEVEDTPDRWVPPVGERERGEKRRWADGVLLGRERMMGRGEEKKGEGGEWTLGRMGKGFGFVFFLFFKTFLNNFSNPFQNQTFYIFYNLLHKLF